MPRPTFLDLHPVFNGSSGFCCANEEPAMWRWLLTKRTFQTAGSIASSGDVLLGALLSRSEKLYAVDHNYTSLAFAGMKAVLLDKLGARGFLASILEGSQQSIINLFMGTKAELPTFLQGRVDRSQFPSSMNELRRVWSGARIGELDIARRRLGALTFIHGDLSDLRQFGQMDCLYVSNAVDSSHNDRHNKIPTTDQMGPLVHRDGLLLVARHVGTPVNPDTSYWAHLKQVEPTDQLGGCRWAYHVHVKKPAHEMEVRTSLQVGMSTIYATPAKVSSAR